MASNSSRRGKYVPLIIYGILSLALGIVYLVCGVTGIIRASLEGDEQFTTHFYYQVVTVGLGVIVAICETVFIICSINMISSNGQPAKPSKLKKYPTNMSLRIGGQDFEEMKPVKLRKFTTSTAFLLLLGLQMINGSLSAVMWGLTFIFSSYRFSGLLNIIPVVLSEALIGIIAPLLVSLAVVPLSHVIRTISLNKLRPKTLLSRFYECIDYKISSDGTPYWIVAGTFYFLEQSSSPNNRVSIFRNLCRKKKTTAVLSSIAILSFMLTGSIFVNDFLVLEFGASSCQDLSAQVIQSTICFTMQPPAFINCSANPVLTNPLTCFEFLSTNGIHAQPLVNAIIEAFVTFVLSNALITATFRAIQFLLYIKRTKLWSILVIGAGFFLFFSSVGLTVVFSIQLTNAFDILVIYELLIISLIIILIGVLLYTGEPYEAISSYDVVPEDYPELQKSYRATSF